MSNWRYRQDRLYREDPSTGEITIDVEDFDVAEDNGIANENKSNAYVAVETRNPMSNISVENGIAPVFANYNPISNVANGIAPMFNTKMTVAPTDEKPPKTPHITQYVPMGDGKEEKMWKLIFISGKQLLENKLENSAKGLHEDKYNKAEHLEQLNLMFPQTLIYQPEMLQRRIQSYMSSAKAKVDDDNKSGQGQEGQSVFPQEESHELQIINLLNDCNKSCKPKITKPKFYGSHSRYVGSDDIIQSGPSRPSPHSTVTSDILENVACCVGCDRENVSLTGTVAGLVCTLCLANDKTVHDKNLLEGDNLADQANIQQQASLMSMDYGKEGTDDRNNQKPEQKIKRRSGKINKRRHSDDSDSEGDELTKLLIAKIRKSDEKESLEMEGFKLKNQLLRRELMKDP